MKREVGLISRERETYLLKKSLGLEKQFSYAVLFTIRSADQTYGPATRSYFFFCAGTNFCHHQGEERPVDDLHRWHDVPTALAMTEMTPSLAFVSEQIILL